MYSDKKQNNIWQLSMKFSNDGKFARGFFRTQQPESRNELWYITTPEPVWGLAPSNLPLIYFTYLQTYNHNEKTWDLKKNQQQIEFNLRSFCSECFYVYLLTDWWTTVELRGAQDGNEQRRPIGQRSDDHSGARRSERPRRPRTSQDRRLEARSTLWRRRRRRGGRRQRGLRRVEVDREHHGQTAVRSVPLYFVRLVVYDSGRQTSHETIDTSRVAQQSK